MASRHTTLQLDTPCSLTAARAWWEEVDRVMEDGGDVATVSVVQHVNGTARLTISLDEEYDDG
jgi:hypothetical protein